MFKDTMVKQKTKGIYIAFGIIILLTPLVLLKGYFYQSQSDTVFPTYIIGYYSNYVNSLPNNYNCFSLISNLLNSLNYDIFNWYDLFQFLIVGSGIIYFIHTILSNRRSNMGIFNKTILVLLCVVLVLDFAFPFEFSKSSFIGTALALHLIFLKKKTKVGMLILFFAFCIRPEASVLSIFIFSTIFYSNLLKNIVKTLCIALILGATVFVISFNNTDVEKYYSSIKKYEYQFGDYEKNYELYSISNKIDSIKFVAASNFFLSDTSSINLDFFEKISLSQNNNLYSNIVLNFFKGNWLNKTHEIEKLFKLSPYFALMFLFILSLIMQRKYILSLILFGHLIFILLFSLLLKIEYHFITPYISLSIISVIIVLKGRFKGFGMINFLVLPLVIAQFLFQYNLTETFKHKSEYFEKIKTDISTDNSDSIRMITINVWDEMHYQLFTDIQARSNNSLINIDGGILYLSSDYMSNLKKLSKEETFDKQLAYLFQQKDNIIYTSLERMDLILSYMEIVYGKKYAYTIIHKFDINSKLNINEVYKLNLYPMN